MRISIIIPSRLAANPASTHGHLYLDRAIHSIRHQTVFAAHEWEFLVGLDANAPWPPERFSDVRFIRSIGAGQALAVNAAAAHATGDVLAFLEDDDQWHPQKLEYQLDALALGYDFVSSSQREVTTDGDYVRVNDFATMSGWAMSEKTWRDVGSMDESFGWHLDTEWLGRLNAAGKKRLHFAEHGAATHGDGPKCSVRPWLHNVRQVSKVATTTDLLEPLVSRTVNPVGGMARIATDPEAAAQSQREHGVMWERFGRIPW